MALSSITELAQPEAYIDDCPHCLSNVAKISTSTFRPLLSERISLARQPTAESLLVFAKPKNNRLNSGLDVAVTQRSYVVRRVVSNWHISAYFYAICVYSFQSSAYGGF